MGFLSRLAILAKADAHGVVDALEDKALVLRQHLRDARAELERKRRRMDALAAEDKDLAGEAGRLSAEIEILERDIPLTLANGEDELARYAIKKLLPLRHGARRIVERRDALTEERTHLAEALAEQEAAFEQLERRVRGYLARREVEPGHCPAFAEIEVCDEDVELELLRRKEGAGEGAG